MVYDRTITTEAEIALMSGQNVGAGATADNNNVLVAHAESFLSNLLREDVIAGFAGYSDAKKQILSEYASRYAGMTLIANDMNAYTSRVEAESMVNIHVLRLAEIKLLLTTDDTVNFLKGT